jgi:putative chitinase
MIPLTSAQLLLLAPNARSSYRTAFEKADEVLASYGINDKKLRLAHFMAQALHESGGLTVLVENMNYSAKRMTQVWPSRFPDEKTAMPYAHNPEKLANKVYGGRMGNDKPGDGWKYIGRGIIQCTGKESYAKFGNLLSIDLVGNPELAIDPRYSLKIACEEWKEKGCNVLADQDDLKAITKKINGGLIGFASRQDWLTKTKKVWK